MCACVAWRAFITARNTANIRITVSLSRSFSATAIPDSEAAAAAAGGEKKRGGERRRRYQLRGRQFIPLIGMSHITLILEREAERRQSRSRRNNDELLSCNCLALGGAWHGWTTLFALTLRAGPEISPRPLHLDNRARAYMGSCDFFFLFR